MAEVGSPMFLGLQCPVDYLLQFLVESGHNECFCRGAFTKQCVYDEDDI